MRSVVTGGDGHGDLLSWTEEGVRGVKDAPKRAAAGREIGKKFGVELKQLFLTTGDFDLLMKAADGTDVAKFCMTLGGLGIVRTKTVRAWPEAELMKIVSELP